VAKGATPSAGAARPEAQRQRTDRRPGGSGSRKRENEPKSAFATELAKAL